MAFLKQSTSATIVMGPFVDSTDGFTPETALTINQANVRVSKNGGSFAAKNNATAATHLENGYYSVPIDTTDTGTLGRLTMVTSGVTGALPVWMEYNIVLANVYDSLITSGDYLDVSTVQWLGTAPNALISGRVDANTSNAVTVSAQTNHPAVSVSAYTNFPQVYVSAGQVTNVTGNVSGSVNNVVVPQSVTVGEVTVSAYKNFPQVYVSAGTVTASSVTDKTGYSITANSDKTNYTVSSGTITTVTGNVNGSVASVTNPVAVSAYTNFPQVTVSANLDKTNYTVSSGIVNIINNSVTVSAYENFPSVDVSSVTNGAITSADFDNDYYNKVQSLTTNVTIGKVQVSGIDGGVYVGTSAYTNFPEVYVSAIAPDIEISATVIVDYDRIMSASISAIDQRFTFSGNSVISYVSGGSISASTDTTSIVNAILAATIDTKTFAETMEILLAMATGRITRVNNKFTYYKQDNTTSLYTLESERSERTRL